jgi:hypothetical protein
MLKLRFTFVLVMCGISFAVAQLSPLEEKIIGMWQFTGTNTTLRIVLRADHTCATLVPITGRRGWEILAKGTWRIGGHQLIRVEKPTFGPSASVDPHGLSVTSKLPIRSITPDRFELGGGPAMKRVK